MNKPNFKREDSIIRGILSISIVNIWVLINTILFCLKAGWLGSWTSIGSPPSGVKRIIHADVSHLWVESQDGEYFVGFNFWPGEMYEDYWRWDLLKDISEIPEKPNPEFRGNNCKKLQFNPFLSNLIGQPVECIYAESPSSFFGIKDKSYFAQMSDGNIFLWKNNFTFLASGIAIINIPLTMLAIFSAIYLIIFGIVHIRRSAGYCLHSDGQGLPPRPGGFLQLGFHLLLAWFRQTPQPAGEARC